MTAAALVAPVQRFCFVRLREEEAPAREELARALRAELTALCAPHPVWVGLPGDESAARWDLGLVISLPDVAAWRQLAATPAFDDAMLRLTAAATVIKAWTFAAP